MNDEVVRADRGCAVTRWRARVSAALVRRRVRHGTRACPSLPAKHVASRDELDVVASSTVRRDPDLYLKHVRPPMLKDYFNPQLRMVMPVHRRLRQITVRFEIEEDFVPAL